MATAIELKNVNKIYGETKEVQVHALQDVDLKIEKGKFVAIVGPSGCGKSTLLNMVGALDNPSSGKIFLDGVDLSELSGADIARVRGKKIGFVFQFFNLFPTLNTLQNVELPMMISGLSGKERKEKARSLLKSVGLQDFEHHFPRQLSGGQQQRLTIARALANDPVFLLADEPTGNLDSKSSHTVLEVFNNLHRKKKATIVMITHEHDIAKYAEEIIHLHDGKVLKITKNKKRRVTKK